jgi:RNA polymerase sigma factor (TIGR02999 family)
LSATRIDSVIESTAPGDAAECFLEEVYTELRNLAAHQMVSQAAGQTLQPTALVHEAWLRLSRRPDRKWNNRDHFLASAAQAMRQILIDRARKQGRVCPGGQWERIDLDTVNLAITDDAELLLRVDEALKLLATEAPNPARLVELRYFAGLGLLEAASTLGISPATAKRYWVFARAWLYHHLKSRD